jgi:hypothetical protein
MLELDTSPAPSAASPHSTDTVFASAYGAVVLAADEVRWQTATRSFSELLRALAEYVEARAPHQLWPADAAHVADCLRRGQHGRAVLHYFAVAGRRWDRERLHWVVPMPIPAPPAPWSEQ